MLLDDASSVSCKEARPGHVDLVKMARVDGAAVPVVCDVTNRRAHGTPRARHGTVALQMLLDHASSASRQEARLGHVDLAKMARV